MTNQGNVTLTRLKFVTDLDGVTCQPAGRTLVPGAQLSCAGTYRVTKADARRGKAVVRTAARAERPYGVASRPSDDVVVEVRRPPQGGEDQFGCGRPAGSLWCQDPGGEDPVGSRRPGDRPPLVGALSLALLTAGGISLRAGRRR